MSSQPRHLSSSSIIGVSFDYLDKIFEQCFGGEAAIRGVFLIVYALLVVARFPELISIPLHSKLTVAAKWHPYGDHRQRGRLGTAICSLAYRG